MRMRAIRLYHNDNQFCSLDAMWVLDSFTTPDAAGLETINNSWLSLRAKVGCHSISFLFRIFTRNADSALQRSVFAFHFIYSFIWRADNPVYITPDLFALLVDEVCLPFTESEFTRKDPSKGAYFHIKTKFAMWVRSKHYYYPSHALEIDQIVDAGEQPLDNTLAWISGPNLIDAHRECYARSLCLIGCNRVFFQS